MISDHSIFESLASLGMKGEARANSFLFREISVMLVTVWFITEFVEMSF